MTVAIVGYGRFGHALGSLLDEARIGYRAWDTAADIPQAHRAGSLQELLSGAEQVVVAVPVPKMKEVLQALSPYLKPEQLVLDVGSVKVKPVQALSEVLGTRVPWAGTHPLFGPLSLAMAERPLQDPAREQRGARHAPGLGHRAGVGPGWRGVHLPRRAALLPARPALGVRRSVR